MGPLIDRLTWAFEVVNYKDPEVLNHIIKNFSEEILKEGQES